MARLTGDVHDKVTFGLDLVDAIPRRLRLSVGKVPEVASLSDWRLALSHAIRDRLTHPWFAATGKIYKSDHKRVYYLSMEYLLGRLLEDAVHNLGLEEEIRHVLAQHGVDFRDLVEDEPDAALGNGGLGRLAACFLDSMSTLGIPTFGYGIRYAHGLFKQAFEDGAQVEMAEDWLRLRNPWEFPRPESTYDVGFGGQVEDGPNGAMWRPDTIVSAEANDTPVPGWRARWVNTLRLWSARPKRIFDLEPFNRGDYMAAAAPEVFAQTITRVLYPDDSTAVGKELRLKQEYFFTSASLQDIIRRFLVNNQDLHDLPNKVAIQMNDTHPAIAGPELVRLLVDAHGFEFEDAFNTAQGCLHYTNHTLLPEALESWGYDLMARTLPRHVQLIERIDDLHARELRKSSRDAPQHVRAIDRGAGQVRMGNLAFICARKVNGVSALHTELMKETVFHDLHALHPEKIINETNGVTPRRWLYGCNPGLRDLLTGRIGESWVTHLSDLEQIAPLADDAGFREQFMAVKRANKAALAQWLTQTEGVQVNPDALFDIQVKRIHEYKRQLMNILETAALANEIRRDPDADWTPRVKIFGGKAAPAYTIAKHIIHLINDIGRDINNDPVIGDRLKVVYPPNYSVSMAERVIPAADLSEQISTAGYEASGTGNMKFAINGAVTIGTLDGANVEIREQVGDENIYIFGKTAEQVLADRPGYDSGWLIANSPRLSEVIGQIETGAFSPEEPGRYAALLHKLRTDDFFMVAGDFDAYYDMQRKIDADFRDRELWARKAVLNTALSGFFSSDRTIRGYAKDIWEVGSLLEPGHDN